MTLLTCCIDCGEACTGAHCPEHTPKLRGGQKKHASHRGYDTAWRKLSERARTLQPFCSMCGVKDDLQGDHSPEAWRRHYAGKPIRLKDIDVLCGPCNRRRGRTRPTKDQGGNPRATTSDPQSVRQNVPPSSYIMEHGSYIVGSFFQFDSKNFRLRKLAFTLLCTDMKVLSALRHLTTLKHVISSLGRFENGYCQGAKTLPVHFRHTVMIA